MLEQEIASFVTVLVVAVGIASLVSVLYATGLRFWAAGQSAVESGGSHVAHRTVSCICFTACVAVILFALWLMIPIFHH